jgi:hypothetical protein
MEFDNNLTQLVFPGPDKLWKVHFALPRNVIPADAPTFRVHACGEMFEHCMKALSHALKRRSALAFVPDASRKERRIGTRVGGGK